MKTNINIIVIVLAAVFTITRLQAQITPFHEEPYALNFGQHQGAAPSTGARNKSDSLETEFKVVEHFVSTGESPWFRMHFAQVNLGKHSYVKIISLADGAEQKLDAAAMKEWNNSSAFFNGNEVLVQLHVAPEEKSISLRVKKLTVGEFIEGDEVFARSQCGSQDNRSRTYTPRSGRIMPQGCTGWIAPNRAYITAGHCAADGPGGFSIIEFKVPSSLPNGTTVAAHPNDQYPIYYNSRVFENGGHGDDWAVFNCGPNSNTGLRPYQAQEAYYRLSKDLNPSSIRITGFGTDNVPAGTTGGRNSDNQTQQTHRGPSGGESGSGSDVQWRYRADTEGGNSGSPVISSGINTVGVHTHGGCSTSGSGWNRGTSLEANDFEQAIQNFQGAGKSYVDAGHPVPSYLQIGTVLRPYRSIQVAANLAPNNRILMIAGGHYNEKIQISATSKALTLRASVGAVVISAGSNATLAISEERVDSSGIGEVFEYDDNGGSAEIEVAEKVSDVGEDGFSVYPNPISSTTTVSYQLPATQQVEIKLIDAMGRVIAMPMANTTQVEGQHRLTWDASQVAAGIYFLVLNTQEGQQVQRVVIAR